MLSDFGGIAKVMPWFAVMLIVATLSSVGLPGTGGFVGEFLILLGTFQSSPLAAVAASLGVLLGAIYMLTLCRKVLFGPLDNPENQELKDLSPREFAYLVPLAILAIVMGIFPNVFLDKVRPSIEYLSANYKNYRLVAESCDSHDQGHDEQCTRAGDQVDLGLPIKKLHVAVGSAESGTSGVTQ
jgi:NADH-quinone oxidoreductase subunit M